MLLNKDESGSAYNRVAGVDANFRFGFLTINGYAAKTSRRSDRCRQRATTSRRARSSNYQRSALGVRAASTTAIGAALQRRDGLRAARRASNNTALFVGRTFRPKCALEAGLREMRPHLQFDNFTAQDGGGLESRYQDWHLPFNFQDSGVHRDRRQPERRGDRRPFTINSARGVQVDPGRYEFNEYFVLWNTNAAARFSFEPRYATGDFYDGYRRGYTVGPALRLNEHFNASVTVQINDIELPTGAFVTNLVTEPRELQLQHEGVRERAGAVQHRHAAVELEPAVQHHPPAAERFLPRLQRAARRRDRRLINRA